MPRLNLKDDSLESEPEQSDSEQNEAVPPALRDLDDGDRGGISPLLWIVLGIIVVAGVVFALNQFKIIHLWGPKPVAVSDSGLDSQLPPPEESATASTTQAEGQITPSTPMPETTQEPSVTQQPTQKPAHTPLPAATLAPPAGAGNFAVQMSAWETQAKANQEAAKLSAAGYQAYVTEGTVAGDIWYRVRVGRYVTMAEARDALRQLSPIAETEPWITQE